MEEMSMDDLFEQDEDGIDDGLDGGTQPFNTAAPQVDQSVGQGAKSRIVPIARNLSSPAISPVHAYGHHSNSLPDRDGRLIDARRTGKHEVLQNQRQANSAKSTDQNAATLAKVHDLLRRVAVLFRKLESKEAIESLPRSARQPLPISKSTLYSPLIAGCQIGSLPRDSLIGKSVPRHVPRETRALTQSCGPKLCRSLPSILNNQDGRQEPLPSQTLIRRIFGRRPLGASISQNVSDIQHATSSGPTAASDSEYLLSQDIPAPDLGTDSEACRSELSSIPGDEGSGDHMVEVGDMGLISVQAIHDAMQGQDLSLSHDMGMQYVLGHTYSPTASMFVEASSHGHSLSSSLKMSYHSGSSSLLKFMEGAGPIFRPFSWRPRSPFVYPVDIELDAPDFVECDLWGDEPVDTGDNHSLPQAGRAEQILDIPAYDQGSAASSSQQNNPSGNGGNRGASQSSSDLNPSNKRTGKQPVRGNETGRVCIFHAGEPDVYPNDDKRYEYMSQLQ